MELCLFSSARHAPSIETPRQAVLGPEDSPNQYEKSLFRSPLFREMTEGLRRFHVFRVQPTNWYHFVPG